MHCTRCKGWMRKEHLLDLEAGFGEMWVESWSCINCGAVHDAVIQENRSRRHQNPWALPVSESTSLQDEMYLDRDAWSRSAA